jgi:hypothetical protein
VIVRNVLELKIGSLYGVNDFWDDHNKRYVSSRKDFPVDRLFLLIGTDYSRIPPFVFQQKRKPEQSVTDFHKRSETVVRCRVIWLGPARPRGKHFHGGYPLGMMLLTNHTLNSKIITIT